MLLGEVRDEVASTLLVERVFERMPLGVGSKEISKNVFEFRKKFGFQLFSTAIFEWIGYDVSE